MPIGLATFVASSRIVPESTLGAATRAFDLAGAVTVTRGLIALVYGIVKAQEFGHGGDEAARARRGLRAQCPAGA